MNDKNLQTLYLLRHAKAEPWIPGANDFERALNPRGVEHMRRLAEWAEAELHPPQAVLCSSAARTRETLEPILERWPELQASTRYAAEIYEATAGTLHALAGAAFRSAARVLMVGHNPGFENLAMAVLRAGDRPRLTRMPTGALAVIDFERGWESDAGNGRLRYWIRRRDLPEAQVGEPA